MGDDFYTLSARGYPEGLEFTTSYMDDAHRDLQGVIDRAVEDLTPYLDDFDTLVGRGFSGGVVIPALALALGKGYVLIRKENDDSHHGKGRLIGTLGTRWIFVDDFVSSGETRQRVYDKIKAACVLNEFASTYVGDYLYMHKPDDDSYPENKRVRWQPVGAEWRCDGPEALDEDYRGPRSKPAAEEEVDDWTKAQCADPTYVPPARTPSLDEQVQAYVEAGIRPLSEAYRPLGYTLAEGVELGPRVPDFDYYLGRTTEGSIIAGLKTT